MQQAALHQGMYRGSGMSEVILIFPDKAAAGVWTSIFKFMLTAGVGPAKSDGNEQVRKELGR